MGFKKQVKKELRYIRVNLKEHMRRTDLLESHIKGITYKAIMGLAAIGGALHIGRSIMEMFR